MTQFLILFKKDIFKHCLIVYYGIAILFLMSSCNSNFTAKPQGYFTIDFPKHEYQKFDQPGYPYSFEFPVYAKVLKDSTFFGGTTENPWWINIDFPQFSGRIYVSYKEIGKNNFDTLIKHAYILTGKHSSKAYSIDDSLINTSNQIHGMFFSVGGDVATSNQFYLTDSTKHFLRGALYFDATPNADSLGIVNQFLLQDMKHLINTFKWKN
jgi:gliding motility-associated lipoprotein GldD